MKAWVVRHRVPLFHTVVGMCLLVQLLLNWRGYADRQEQVRDAFADLLASAKLDVPTDLLVSSPRSLIITALLAGLLLGMALGAWAAGARDRGARIAPKTVAETGNNPS